MSEALITKQTRNLLKKYETNGEPLYFNKISDRYTSGIPDFQGTFYGISWYVELKDEGKELRNLQAWHLKRAKHAGAETLSTDCFQEVECFFKDIKENHAEISKHLQAHVIFGKYQGKPIF